MPTMPERRSGTVQIGAKLYRVREPAPRRAFRVIAQVTTLLGSAIAKVLSGQLVVYEPPVCPVCETAGQAKTADANDRWACRAEHDGVRCTAVWDKRPITGPDGKPQKVGLSYVLGQRDLRAALAYRVEERISSMDPDEVLALAESALPGAADFNIGGSWVEIRTPESLDHYLPSGMAIAHLLRAALEAWILPSLVDDWTDTTLASSTSVTTRDGGHPTTDGSSGGLPAPAPSATRAPPPVRRNG